MKKIDPKVFNKVFIYSQSEYLMQIINELIDQVNELEEKVKNLDV